MLKEDSLSDRLAPIPKVARIPPGSRMLLRSRSFNMLRQFPAYLCRAGSSADIVHWLYESRTKLSTSFSLFQKEAQQVLLLLSIWSCVLFVGFEAACAGAALTLMKDDLPLGFLFMVSCILVMGSMAARVILPGKKKSFKR